MHVSIYSYPKSSWLWQGQDSVIQGLDVQIQDHQGTATWIPAIGGEVDLGLYPRLGRRMFQQSQYAVLHGSWLILG